MSSPEHTREFVEELVVEENYDGWRLDRYLTEKIRRASRSQVRRYLAENVTITPTRKVKPGTTVRCGDTIRITRREKTMPDVPGPEAMQVLQRRGEVAVVTKPPGVLVHRNSREVSNTVETYLRHVFPDEPHAEAVHRLDRETTGCLVVAFGSEAVVRWRSAFQAREVRKTYLALVPDPELRWPPAHQERIDQPLGPDPRSVLSVRMASGHLSARTDVRVLHRVDDVALLALYPLEGRQHQLRAHLALSGTPILGDKLYAAGDEYFMRWSDDPWGTREREPLETPFHCLHAWRIALPGAEGAPLEGEAPPPAHFARWLGGWSGDDQV